MLLQTSNSEVIYLSLKLKPLRQKVIRFCLNSSAFIFVFFSSISSTQTPQKCGVFFVCVGRHESRTQSALCAEYGCTNQVEDRQARLSGEGAGLFAIGETSVGFTFERKPMKACFIKVSEKYCQRQTPS